MNERVYNNGIERLRSEDRVGRLEIEKVVDLCLQELKINLSLATLSVILHRELSKPMRSANVRLSFCCKAKLKGESTSIFKF